MTQDLHKLDLTWLFWSLFAALLVVAALQPARRKRIIDGLASYQLSVFCLAGLFLISWLGTVAQVDIGLFRAQKVYFESWLLTERVHLPGDWRLSLPLPGGQLLMSLLAVNLLFGGLVRVWASFRAARSAQRRSMLLALLATHLGVVLLLAAGIVKLHASENGHVTLYEGESTSEFVSFHEWEVALHEVGPTEDVEEWIVPESDFLDLGRDSRSFSAAELPFGLVLQHFEPNARVLPVGAGAPPSVLEVDGWVLTPQEMDNTHERNFAGVIARLSPRGGQPVTAILSGLSRFPFTFEAEGATWAIELRRKRYDLPGEIELVDFHRELHPRTGMASVFRSDVLWREGEGEQASEDQIRIAMNEPLRRGGLALFQANWGPQDDPNAARLYSQLEVTRNPSDHWPTVAVIVIGVAMSVALALKFQQWLRQQSSRAARKAGA